MRARKQQETQTELQQEKYKTKYQELMNNLTRTEVIKEELRGNLTQA